MNTNLLSRISKARNYARAILLSAKTPKPVEREIYEILGLVLEGSGLVRKTLWLSRVRYDNFFCRIWFSEPYWDPKKKKMWEDPLKTFSVYCVPIEAFGISEKLWETVAEDEVFEIEVCWDE